MLSSTFHGGWAEGAIASIELSLKLSLFGISGVTGVLAMGLLGDELYRPIRNRMFRELINSLEFGIELTALSVNGTRNAIGWCHQGRLSNKWKLSTYLLLPPQCIGLELPGTVFCGNWQLERSRSTAHH